MKVLYSRDDYVLCEDYGNLIFGKKRHNCYGKYTFGCEVNGRREYYERCNLILEKRGTIRYVYWKHLIWIQNLVGWTEDDALLKAFEEEKIFFAEKLINLFASGKKQEPTSPSPSPIDTPYQTRQIVDEVMIKDYCLTLSDSGITIEKVKTIFDCSFLKDVRGTYVTAIHSEINPAIKQKAKMLCNHLLKLHRKFYEHSSR